MTKRVLITGLVLVNLVLLACLVLTTYSPPQAVAQAVSRAGQYILIAAEAERTNDVVYLLDLEKRELHAFRSHIPPVAGAAVQIAWHDMRDLRRDFRR